MSQHSFLTDLDAMAARRDAVELNSLRLAAHNARADGNPEHAAEHEADAAAFMPAVIKELHGLYGQIRRKHNHVPAAVIIVASGREGVRGGGKHGHFGAKRWTLGKKPGEKGAGAAVHEIMIAGERLADGVDGVLSTLLHEAVHAFCQARGIKDTSNGPKYHNKLFKAHAEDFGLHVEKMGGGHGWTMTCLGDGAATAYNTDALSAALTGARAAMLDLAEKPTRKNAGRLLKYVCGCDKPRVIRAAAGTMEEGPVVCGVCKQMFHAEEPEDGDGEED